MGEVNENEEEEQSSFPTLKLPFLPLPPSSMHSPEYPSSGTATPPLRTLASVPFKWEEEPGKPRPCTDIIIPLPEPTRCLELQLPPCRLQLSMDSRITKTPSPTTVLDGPCNVGRPKFSSFRFFKEAHDSYESSSTDSISSYSPEGLLLGKIKSNGGQKGKGCFRKFNGGSFRFSSSSSSITDENCVNVKIDEKIKRKGSFCHDAKSTHIWAAIYEGLKHVIPWKSGRKSKKEVKV